MRIMRLTRTLRREKADTLGAQSRQRVASRAQARSEAGRKKEAVGASALTQLPQQLPGPWSRADKLAVNGVKYLKWKEGEHQ